MRSLNSACEHLEFYRKPPGLHPGLPQSLFHTTAPLTAFLCMSYHTTALLQTLQHSPITKNKMPSPPHTHRAGHDPGSGYLPVLLLLLARSTLVGLQGLGPAMLLSPVPTWLPHFPGPLLTWCLLKMPSSVPSPPPLPQKDQPLFSVTFYPPAPLYVFHRACIPT